MVSSCLLVITPLCNLPHECAGPSDSLLTNNLAKVVGITFEIRLQKDQLPSCWLFLTLPYLLWGKIVVVSCATPWRGPQDKDLMPTKSHVSWALKWILPPVELHFDCSPQVCWEKHWVRGPRQAVPEFLTYRNCEVIICCFKPLTFRIICLQQKIIQCVRL